MSLVFRFYIEKKGPLADEAKSLLHEIRDVLQITSVSKVRIINTYDISELNGDQTDMAVHSVLSESNTDNVYVEMPDFENAFHFATEFLPGQFDQRADSAEQCLKLILDDWDGKISTGQIIICYGSLTETQKLQIKDFVINPVESREKDLSRLSFDEYAPVKDPVPTLTGFINKNSDELAEMKNDWGIAASVEDLLYIQDYFRTSEKRDPTETEIRVLDTYWSDHCRHTTFETELTNIRFPENALKPIYQEIWDFYQKAKNDLNRSEKPVTLMDLATIYGRFAYQSGLLSDLDVSDEINACSVKIKVDVNGKYEDWLLMFKNETHNHPTEIEPFGGAATCIGGAIRDPLSGRSYVYQAIRITGAANPLESLEKTLAGKLPQRVISRTAARGYSSYGNQIGLATSYVREIFHPGYRAKRMEVGAVVGAVKYSSVRRDKPQNGDLIVLLGGKTGRDGCGGATGSSKEHTEDSLATCGAEVQKGNPPEERKIQRLFRNPALTKLIKKCNDFGAGGVSVAVGELSDGLEIDLNAVPLKYLGLNGTEIAISESQERMAIVIDPSDLKQFLDFASDENLEATVVAKVTDKNRLKMTWNGQSIVDISRDFLDTHGVRSQNDVTVPTVSDLDIFARTPSGNDFPERFINNITMLNTASQRGLMEMFDSSIGASTVVIPYGGLHRATENEASVHKLPVSGETKTVSLISFGYNPEISSNDPFLGSIYAVTESICKIAAAGGKWKNIRFSFQEYFKRLGTDPDNWGLPFSALMGALWAQKEWGMPAIGGKDSMSGTFHEIDVPPTLISFAVTTGNTETNITADLKKPEHYVYLLPHIPQSNGLPDVNGLKHNFDILDSLNDQGRVFSAASVREGGLAEALVRMSLGNRIGIKLESISEKDLFGRNIGSIIIETDKPQSSLRLLGMTTGDQQIIINGYSFALEVLSQKFQGLFSELFNDQDKENLTPLSIRDDLRDQTIVKPSQRIPRPRIIIPVFPGTNCEYDSAAAFEKAGGKADILVFRNRTKSDIQNSLQTLSEKINQSQILMLAGGFSAGDEPDGSGKFIANILRNNLIMDAVHDLLDRDGLILGICNGFQALMKSGLLPNGEIGLPEADDPTLVRNSIGRHVSRMVYTRTVTNNSPWLSSFNCSDIHTIAVSHGEGRFYGDEAVIDKLFKNGQVAFQYADENGLPTMDSAYNPNGSVMAIEGLISPDGRILGKMGHSERYTDGCFQNVYGNKQQDIFGNGIQYFL